MFHFQNDPEAHNKFVKINRAYEVLKDEDLRKKYDMHGEEGLSDDFQQGRGRRYESWKFYQEEFGRILIIFPLVTTSVVCSWFFRKTFNPGYFICL